MRGTMLYLCTGICVCLDLVAGIAAADPSDTIVLTLREPLDRDWAPAWVSLPVQLPAGLLRPGQLVLRSEDGGGVESSFTIDELHGDGTVRKATAYVYTALKAGETKVFHVSGAVERPPGVPILRKPGPDGSLIVETDVLSIRTVGGTGILDPPVPVAAVPAAIQAVARPGGNWLGAGRFVGAGQVRGFTTKTDDSLPHQLRHEVRYHFTEGGDYAVRLTVTLHEPAVMVEEDFSSVGGGGLVFDFHPGLEPTMGQGQGRLAPPGAGNVREGYPIAASPDWVGRLQPFYAWWTNYGLWWSAYRPQGDYVGLFMTHPPGWSNPVPNVVQIHTGGGPRVEAFFPLERGTRRWGIIVAPAEEALRRSAGGANLVQRTMIRLAQNPLDRVKDLVLTWPGREAITNPRLLCTPADVPRIREMARSHALFKRVLEQYPDSPDDPAGLYLATGDERHAREAIAGLVGKLRGWIEAALDGLNYTEAIHDIGFTRPLRSAALVYDLVAASPSMTSQQRDYCLRALTFLAYCLYDENRWPGRFQGFHRGNVNFHSDDYTCRAAVVCLLDGHPRQREWMDYVAREMEFEFASSVYPGGAWCEAPNYQGYTMHYLMIAMRAMQLNGFPDFSKDPRFRATMDYFFRIQTPYDVRARMHMLPTVGDTTSYYHSQSLQNTFAWAAKLLRDDPELAGRMMHAWRRGGSIVFGAHGLGPGNGWTQPLTLIDPAIPEAPPRQPLVSEKLPGYGAVLRNNFGTNRESYFLFKMGPADQHYDADEGSFHWYALGRPLSLDFGSMYEPSIEQPWLHSTVDFERDGVRFRTWSRGEVTQFVSLPGVDFCAGRLAVSDLQAVPDLPEQPLPAGAPGRIARTPRFVDWQRQVLFIKGADYIVIRDDLDDADDKFATGWTVQVLASDARIEGRRARFVGQHGVDLDVLVAEPAQGALSTSTWGYKPHETPAWVSPDPMPAVSETQIALKATAPVDGDYLAAMFPYEHDAGPPAIEHPGPAILRISHRDGSDMVFFGGSVAVMQIGEVTFAGRVGVVRRAPEVTTLHILDGVSLDVPEMLAQFPGPVTIEIRKGHLRGVADGPARSCFLRWRDPPPIPARLTIDGREAYVYSTFDGNVGFTVPEGRHAFEVRHGPNVACRNVGELRSEK